MFKINNNISPSHLDILKLPKLSDDNTRNLRNRISEHNIVEPKSRIVTYSNSFLPRTIRDWNNLDDSIKDANTFESFKSRLKRLNPFSRNKLYFHFDNPQNVNHTRMRLGLSGLNAHLNKIGIHQDGLCTYCNEEENVTHYFLKCRMYNVHRQELVEELHDVFNESNIEIKDDNHLIYMILFGSNLLQFDKNVNIFSIVQQYIKNTGRFDI